MNVKVSHERHFRKAKKHFRIDPLEGVPINEGSLYPISSHYEARHTLAVEKISICAVC